MMKLKSLLPVIQAEALTNSAETEVGGAYISDLLSDVLAHTGPGVLWITIQTHRNVVSVASMKDITAILFTCGRKPDARIVAEAEKEGLTLLTTPLSSYEAAGKLWEAGLRK
jgi:hypothetical protein